MMYPEWAPSVLVELHKRRIDKQANITNTEDIIERIRSRADIHPHPIFALSDKEITDLLEKLTTNLKMRDVWKILGRRITDDKYYLRFFNQSHSIIASWRVAPKLTQKEWRDQLLEVDRCAMALLSALENTQLFDHYSIVQLISKESVSWLLSALDSRITSEESKKYGNETDSHLDYAAFSLDDVVPRMDVVLQDISQKAREYADGELVVKRPNSENAEIQFYVRKMSANMKKDYGQPLHDVVAGTASVLFDKEIDSDYVRKIVK